MISRSDNDYGLVWKVEGYDDRFPGDLGLFDRVGVYGVLKDNKLHDSYMGACEMETSVGSQCQRVTSHTSTGSLRLLSATMNTCLSRCLDASMDELSRKIGR